MTKIIFFIILLTIFQILIFGTSNFIQNAYAIECVSNLIDTYKANVPGGETLVKEISDKNNENGLQGKPHSDTLSPLATKNLDGCYQWFTNSQKDYDIIASVSTGAHVVVNGPIYSSWQRLGWETGVLGYPKGEQTMQDGTIYQNFEGGVICQDASGKTNIVKGGDGSQSCLVFSQPSSNQPIEAIPYSFTLTAQDGPLTNVDYKISINYNENFKIAKIIIGTFDSVVIDGNTVIFHVNNLANMESRNGWVGISFKDNTMTETRKGTYNITVDANGKTGTRMIDPGLADINTIVTAGQTALNLLVDISNLSQGCSNLQIKNTSLPDIQSPTYEVNMTNCSLLTEHVSFTTSGNKDEHFTGLPEGNIGANSAKLYEITLASHRDAPASSRQFFKIIADVTNYFLGMTWKSNPSVDSYYDISSVTVPEFGPVYGIVITIAVIGSLVISRRFSKV